MEFLLFICKLDGKFLTYIGVRFSAIHCGLLSLFDLTALFTVLACMPKLVRAAIRARFFKLGGQTGREELYAFECNYYSELRKPK